jgi:hypothetical protein
VNEDFRPPRDRERRDVNHAATIAFMAVKHGADSPATGEKLDKSFDLRYIRGNSQICKSL